MGQNAALVNKFLTNVLQGYVPTGMVSEMLLPKLNVVQQTGKIAKRGLAHLRIENAIMTSKSGARRIEVRQYNSDTYSIKEYGLEELLGKSEYRNVEAPFDLERDTVMALTMALFLGKEKALADSITNTSIITQNVTLSGTSQFNDYTNSDPIGVALTAKNTIRLAAGWYPDTMVADKHVIETLRYHPKILRNLGYADARAGQLTNDDLARAFGIDRILAADVQYNSAKEGQTEALAPIWGKDLVFCKAPATAAIDQKSLGYLVQFAGQSPRAVYKNPVINPPGATSIIVEDQYDMLLTDVKCAYLVKAAIA